jgi:hypothetical protein
MDQELRVLRTHHIDSAEPNLDGTFDWRYEYDLYDFRLGDLTLRARAYVDEPGQAHFLGLEDSGRRRLLTPEDLEGRLVTAAARHMQGLGYDRLTYLGGPSPRGYSPLP